MILGPGLVFLYPRFDARQLGFPRKNGPRFSLIHDITLVVRTEPDFGVPEFDAIRKRFEITSRAVDDGFAQEDDLAVLESDRAVRCDSVIWVGIGVGVGIDVLVLVLGRALGFGQVVDISTVVGVGVDEVDSASGRDEELSVIS